MKQRHQEIRGKANSINKEKRERSLKESESFLIIHHLFLDSLQKTHQEMMKLFRPLSAITESQSQSETLGPLPEAHRLSSNLIRERQ